MHMLTAIFLYPLSLLYASVVWVRNKLYDWKVFKSVEFDMPVITVGNITVGGTGKTPHTELLVALLKDKLNVAVLSRGYKRSTRGFRYVETTDTVASAGDEPLQMKCKYPKVTVAVDADRVAGIRRLVQDVDRLGAVILDDAYQHRRVKPSLSILLVDYNQPITQDHYLPYGRLRDSLSQKHRADVVIVTKCPAKMQPIELRVMIKKMALYPYQCLYFTGLEYGLPQPVFPGASLPLTVKHTVALTGIAHPDPFIAHLSTYSQVKQHLRFPDHHAFTKRDIASINTAVAVHPGLPVFTTEKDAQRLRMAAEYCSEEVRKRLFYIPIRVSFLSAAEGERFTRFITNYVLKNKRNTILHH